MAVQLQEFITWSEEDVNELISYFKKPYGYEKRINGDKGGTKNIAIQKNNLKLKINRLKFKFKFFKGTFPKQWKSSQNCGEVSLIEMIVKICCALLNIWSKQKKKLKNK